MFLRVYPEKEEKYRDKDKDKGKEREKERMVVGVGIGESRGDGVQRSTKEEQTSVVLLDVPRLDRDKRTAKWKASPHPSFPPAKVCRERK